MNNAKIEILLVEDNADEAELTIRSLRKNNLANHLVHLDDGEETLDFIFSRGKYDGQAGGGFPKLILLDLKLPKIDGLEIIRQLKSDPQTRRIPIVVLTSSREENDIIESYHLGVNSYIIKPVNFESFAKVISDLGMYWLILNQSPVA